VPVLENYRYRSENERGARDYGGVLCSASGRGGAVSVF